MPNNDINSRNEILSAINSPNGSNSGILANPSIINDVRKVRSNKPTRSEGTTRQDAAATAAYFAKNNNTIAPGTKDTVIDPSATSSKEITASGTKTKVTPQTDSASKITNTSNTSASIINGEDASKTKTATDPKALQAQADKTATVSGSNKSFPYISALSSTNFASLKPIEPLAVINNGTGSVYDPKLLNDEGVIYLRQYISAEDETTGAVWRFQYAPQISYTRSSTFQEDKSWGTNVQPSHFNNTSGKSIQISGAILEGMTIGSTITGAVTALETLMSVVNPDNQLQVAPYAYRLIIGSRTLKEPISDKHSPFIIESISVKEEMYDNAGELLMAKIDMSLKEVPYYQINDGRKLLLVTKETVTEGEEVCTTITKQISELNAAASTRYGKNIEAMKQATDGANGKLAAAAKTITTTHAKLLETNCVADSEAYIKLAKLFIEYSTNKCTQNKDTNGFDLILKQFAYKSGIYEVMKGRKLEATVSWFSTPVFDTNGQTVKMQDRLKQLNISPNTVDSKAIPYINVLALKSSSLSSSAFTNTDFLPSCPSIACVDKSTAGNTNEDNLKYAMSIAEKILNSSDPKTFLSSFSKGSKSEILAARKSIFNGRGISNRYVNPLIDKDVLSINRTNPSYFYPCGNDSLEKNLSAVQFLQYTAKDVGLSTSGEIANKATKKLSTIIDSNFTTKIRSIVALDVQDLRTFHGGAQACLCGLYLLEAIENDIKGATKSSCSAGAAKVKKFEIYQNIVNRLSALYMLNTKKYKLAASSITNEISDINKASCGNNRSKGNYVDCRSSYCLAYTVKKIVALFEDLSPMSNPIKSVTDALK